MTTDAAHRPSQQPCHVCGSTKGLAHRLSSNRQKQLHAAYETRVSQQLENLRKTHPRPLDKESRV